MEKSSLITVALIGNPNTGKSTLFNALSGLQQRVGNYPGVTVEKKIGRTNVDGQEIVLIDLPGTYSLSPRSPDEMVAVDVLLQRQREQRQQAAGVSNSGHYGGPQVDVVLCIVDASNLERNLYLVSQVLGLEIPTVIALNMMDVAVARGMEIDVAALQERLQLPVAPIEAHRRQGVAELLQVLAGARTLSRPQIASPFPAEFQREVDCLTASPHWNGNQPPRFLAERLLLDVSGYIEQDNRLKIGEDIKTFIHDARSRLNSAGCPIPAVEAISRYQWASSVLDNDVLKIASAPPRTFSDKIDFVLTHRIWGVVAFVILMLLLFQSVFWVAEPASRAIDALMASASGLVSAQLSPGPLRSLLTDGVINGVGGVLVFLPQIFTLFLFIGTLEDCGYMARAAYLMDRVMSPIGLSGKSFIPLLSSFACAIPGIMATRVIENRRDRLITILVAPLMSCSARLPVYSLLIRVFIPDKPIVGPLLSLQGLTMFSMYLLGTVTAIAVVFLLRKTVFRGPASSFVLEFPSYKLPGIKLVMYRMLDSGWEFVRRVGTLILAVSVLVWAAAYYPHDDSRVPVELRSKRADLASRVESRTPRSTDDLLTPEQLELLKVENEIEGYLLRDSYLGRIGRSLEPAFRPLGWDWRIGCAVIASFPAREVVIATLGVIYNLGSGLDEGSKTLHSAIQSSTWDESNRQVFSIPVALSLMVFFSLCAQCASTLVVMRRETGTWRWPVLTFVYMTSLAYCAALLTYQIGSRI